VRVVEPVARFRSAISRLTTCSLIVGISWLALYADYGRSQYVTSRILVTSILTGTQLLALLILMATIFAVQRRPTVFDADKKIVEQQMNGSLWSRYSFYWCTDILTIASKDGLENLDIPSMDYATRSKDVVSRFQNMVLKEDKLPLSVQIFWEFRGEFIWQWMAILLSNFFDVAPAFATLQLLRALESRKDVNDLDPTAWKYVVGIIVAASSSHMIDSRIYWRQLSRMNYTLTKRLQKLICLLHRNRYSTSINARGTCVYEIDEEERF
jgi:hypothetical protein